jgi:hypothetical protein
MVDNSALEFGKRGKVLVEVPLREPRSQTHPTDAERARPFRSGDLEGGRYQPVSSIETPVVGADSLEGHRHLVLHPEDPS